MKYSFARKPSVTINPGGWLRVFTVLFCLLALGELVSAQDSSSGLALPATSDPGLWRAIVPTQHAALLQSQTAAGVRWTPTSGVAVRVASSGPAVPIDGPRRITLDEAKQQAAAADNPMVRLGQLQVEAAKQHRMGTQSDYFPKLSTTLTNFHFNKFMGQEVTVQRPIAGGTSTIGLPLAGKDQTLIAVTAAQPLTPLLKLREVVHLAQADENIARAKAGMPVSETATNVEKNYYGLLVAQRELTIAKAKAENLRSQQLLASNGTIRGELRDRAADELECTKAVVLADSKAKELMASLNVLLGYPAETELELVAPSVQFEELSLKEVSDKAMVANPEVVEAEQTVMKARAGSKLSKLDYIPDFAVLGGYAYNDNAIPLLPRDFSFIGIMGSYNLFDFGKREHTVKERSAQLSAAELALQLTKAKVGAAVKASYFEMDRSRQLSELAHRMASTLEIQRTSYPADNSEASLSKAKVEVEMLQADLEYRQALARLKGLIGER